MSNPNKQELAYITKASKVRLHLLPYEAQEQGALAMMDGAAKYGEENWRTDERVTREKLLEALDRHLLCIRKGETHAHDSGVHHLGHIIANCSILLARFEKESKEETK